MLQLHGIRTRPGVSMGGFEDVHVISPLHPHYCGTNNPSNFALVILVPEAPIVNKVGLYRELRNWCH